MSAFILLDELDGSGLRGFRERAAGVQLIVTIHRQIHA